jgi:hypothetical protein
MGLSSQEIQDIYRRTSIVRRPTYGIISGYHELPYVCIGESFDHDGDTTRVSGKIHVSPRFVIRPSHLGERYEEIFGEDNVDMELAGRMFGFLGFRERPVECKSEYLNVNHSERSVDEELSVVLDELNRMEDITTGVIITPNSRYYPVSIERFIATILDDEFSA